MKCALSGLKPCWLLRYKSKTLPLHSVRMVVDYINARTDLEITRHHIEGCLYAETQFSQKRAQQLQEAGFDSLYCTKREKTIWGHHHKTRAE